MKSSTLMCLILQIIWVFFKFFFSMPPLEHTHIWLAFITHYLLHTYLHTYKLHWNCDLKGMIFKLEIATSSHDFSAISKYVYNKVCAISFSLYIRCQLMVSFPSLLLVTIQNLDLYLQDVMRGINEENLSKQRIEFQWISRFEQKKLLKVTVK